MHDFYRIVSAFYWTKFHSSRLLVTFMTFRNKTHLDYCRKSVPTSQLHYRGMERDIEKSRRLRSVERLDLYPSEIPTFLSYIHYEIRVILCKFFYPLKSHGIRNQCTIVLHVIKITTWLWLGSLNYITNNWTIPNIAWEPGLRYKSLVPNRLYRWLIDK